MPSQESRISYCMMQSIAAAINMIAETAAEEAIAILEANNKNATGDNEHE